MGLPESVMYTGQVSRFKQRLGATNQTRDLKNITLEMECKHQKCSAYLLTVKTCFNNNYDGVNSTTTSGRFWSLQYYQIYCTIGSLLIEYKNYICEYGITSTWIYRALLSWNALKAWNADLIKFNQNAAWIFKSTSFRFSSQNLLISCCKLKQAQLFQ